MTFGILASSHPLTQSGYEAAVLTDSPYAYYRLKDASGNPADSSGNSRNATGVNSAPTYHTTGGPVSDGGYLTFDGTDDYVTLGNIDAIWNGLDEGSVEMWLRWTTTAAANVFGTLNDGVTTMVQGGISQFQDETSDAGDIAGYLRFENGGYRRFSQAGSWNDGNWHHVVWAWDFSTTTSYRIYVDGVEYAGSLDTAGGGTNPLVSDMATFDYPMVLGARNVRGTIARFAPTDMAEVAFYAAELSSARVSAHYAAA